MQWYYPEATVLVPRAKAAQIAGKLLTDLDVADVNIEEPSIEAIIRDLFEAQGKK